MSYYVYLIKTVNSKFNKSYVGYTNNIKKRLYNHNNNKGAKSTKGHKWKLIFKKKFLIKREAMVYEYKLKKDRKIRAFILKNYNVKRK